MFQGKFLATNVFFPAVGSVNYVMRSRRQWEEHERCAFAPYATLSSQSGGREHPEETHEFRPEYQRDRDRIIHSTAFRRLEYKTQVVLNGTGDHFRTRLTHTIEVAAVARTTARALALNEDLAEAIALAHDLGHPPFGHPGEDTLNELMKDHGGFEHNRQSLRVVEELETKYPGFDGLNLTSEVRDGIRRAHHSQQPGQTQSSLEAQVTDIADQIAYCCHDLDDALEHNLISPEQLRHIELWRQLDSSIREKYPQLEDKRRHPYLIRCLIDLLVEDLCRQSSQNLAKAKPANAQAAQNSKKRLISLSSETQSEMKSLNQFLYAHFYDHPKLGEIKNRACEMLRELFEFYCAHPDTLGDKSAPRIQKEGLHRAVCDYVAGMTDRYALLRYVEYVGEGRMPPLRNAGKGEGGGL